MRHYARGIDHEPCAQSCLTAFASRHSMQMYFLLCGSEGEIGEGKYVISDVTWVAHSFL